MNTPSNEAKVNSIASSTEKIRFAWFLFQLFVDVVNKPSSQKMYLLIRMDIIPSSFYCTLRNIMILPPGDYAFQWSRG